MSTRIEKFEARLNQDGKTINVTYQNDALTIGGIDQITAFGFIGTLFGVLGQMGDVEQRINIKQTVCDVTPPKVNAPTKEVAAPPLPPANDEPRPGARLPDPQPESVKRKKREVAPTVSTPPTLTIVKEPPASVAVATLQLGTPVIEDVVAVEEVKSAPRETAMLPGVDVTPPPASTVFDLLQAAKDLDGVTYMSKIVVYLIEHGIKSRAQMVAKCKELRPLHRALSKLTTDELVSERVNRACVGVEGVED